MFLKDKDQWTCMPNQAIPLRSMSCVRSQKLNLLLTDCKFLQVFSICLFHSRHFGMRDIFVCLLLDFFCLFLGVSEWRIYLPITWLYVVTATHFSGRYVWEILQSLLSWNSKNQKHFNSRIFQCKMNELKRITYLNTIWKIFMPK